MVMAIISVEVPDVLATKFNPYQIVQLEDLSIEEQLLREDWEWWNTIVDFWKWVWKQELEAYFQKCIDEWEEDIAQWRIEAYDENWRKKIMSYAFKS